MSAEEAYGEYAVVFQGITAASQSIIALLIVSAVFLVIKWACGERTTILNVQPTPAFEQMLIEATQRSRQRMAERRRAARRASPIYAASAPDVDQQQSLGDDSDFTS